MVRSSTGDASDSTGARSGSGPSRIPVAIIGAGLTGMAAAFQLKRSGVPFRIFERLDRPGGHVVTDVDAGFRFDRTGHLLHADDAEIRRLALGWIGPKHREIERCSAVWSHGGYTRYPFQANLYGLPPEVASDCLIGFIRAWHERAVSPDAPSAESFEQFCLRTFGRGISERFMLPYNSRLWGVPPHEITAQWCARFVPVPTLEEVVRGSFARAEHELGYNTRFVYPEGGIWRLSQGLAQAVGTIELGRQVRAIRSVTHELELEGETVRYDLLINTSPLPRLVAMIEDAPAPIQEAAKRLRATHLWYLDVALNRPCGQPYQWVYVPEPKYPFYRVGCYSHFSVEMAPPGKACLYVELCDRQEPVLGEILPRVAQGLQEMGIVAGPEAIAFARLKRLDPAYVIFDHGTPEALARLRPFLQAQWLLSVGRYGGWNYSSMAEALRFGLDAALEAERLLGAGAGRTKKKST